MQIFERSAMELRVGKKYRLSKKIGGGSFGDIFHGERRQTVVASLCDCCSSLYDDKIFEFSREGSWPGVHLIL